MSIDKLSYVRFGFVVENNIDEFLDALKVKFGSVLSEDEEQDYSFAPNISHLTTDPFVNNVCFDRVYDENTGSTALIVFDYLYSYDLGDKYSSFYPTNLIDTVGYDGHLLKFLDAAGLADEVKLNWVVYSYVQ